jgi:hypothetical protein
MYKLFKHSVNVFACICSYDQIFFAKNIETFLKKKDRAVKTRVLSTENDEKMPECKKNL